MPKTVKQLTQEIEAARDAGDWDRVSILHDQRRCAEVDADEARLAGNGVRDEY